MQAILVTGATGLLGSNICEALAARGDRVRALVRRADSPDAKALAGAGIEVVPGDIADRSAVMTASEGMNGVIHAAAVLGRPGITFETAFPANVIGTINVLSAAALAGIPVVQVLTSTFFDTTAAPLTEHSPFDLGARMQDVYSITKRLAYAEGFTRVAEGQDIRFMCPGAMYGPSLCTDLTVQPNSFNGRLARAIRGDMPPQLPTSVTYVAAQDCADVCIAALDRGTRGERYICHGLPEDRRTIAENCNFACELAGVPHRVSEIPRDQLDSPEVIAQFGPVMPVQAKRANHVHNCDDTYTRERLGCTLTPISVGFPGTIAWMREKGFI